MDFLCKRYGGSPFFILDRYIEQGRLYKFIYEVWSIHNDEEIYDIWLHKIDNQSYQDFRDSLIPPEPVKKEDIAQTIDESMNILNGFAFEEEKQHG